MPKQRSSITFPDALRAFPDVPRETLDTWRRRCPYVKAHKLWWRFQPGTQADGRRRKRVCVLRRSELETVIAAYRRRDKEVPRFSRRGTSLPHDGAVQRAYWASRRTIRESGCEWILQGEACRLAGVSSATIWRWMKIGCPLLGGSKLRTLVDHTLKGGVVRFARSELEAIATAGSARRGDSLPGYIPIAKIRKEQRCSYDTLRRQVPSYDRMKREALVEVGRRGLRQYQTFLPAAAVKAFVESRRARTPAAGKSVEEARKQLHARGLRISQPSLTRLCLALGVEKHYFRSTGVGKGKGRRLAYLLSASDIAHIEDVLRRASSIREAARLL